MEITSFSGFFAINFANILTFLLLIVFYYGNIRYIHNLISFLEYIKNKQQGSILMQLALNDEIFSKNLAYLRKKRKLSQVKLAQQAGINVYLLRSIERRRFRADLEIGQYISLCCILQVSPSLMGSYDLSNTDDITKDISLF